MESVELQDQEENKDTKNKGFRVLENIRVAFRVIIHKFWVQNVNSGFSFP